MLKRMFLVIVIVFAAGAFPTPAEGADEPKAAALIVQKSMGYFEEHYCITEGLTLAALSVLMVIAELSNSRFMTLPTTHRDYFGMPMGKSYTEVPVAKEPSSWRQIRKSFIFYGLVYFCVRVTCLAGFFNLSYQFIGSLIDIAIRH